MQCSALRVYWVETLTSPRRGKGASVWRVNSLVVAVPLRNQVRPRYSLIPQSTTTQRTQLTSLLSVSLKHQTTQPLCHICPCSIFLSTMASSSEGILDASISFGQRSTTRLPPDLALADDYEHEHYEFLALITAIAELYFQHDVLEMQPRMDKGEPLAHGAVSEVSTIYTAFTSPSAVISHRIRRKKHVVVIKQSESKLFMPNGQHNNESAIKSFISEIRILSHKYLREH